jgi:hypothetical protein
MISDKIYRTYAEASAATGLGVYTLKAIKLASIGKPGSPFTGRLTTQRRLLRWLEENPSFVPRHEHFKKKNSKKREDYAVHL